MRQQWVLLPRHSTGAGCLLEVKQHLVLRMQFKKARTKDLIGRVDGLELEREADGYDTNGYWTEALRASAYVHLRLQFS